MLWVQRTGREVPWTARPTSPSANLRAQLISPAFSHTRGPHNAADGHFPAQSDSLVDVKQTHSCRRSGWLSACIYAGSSPHVQLRCHTLPLESDRRWPWALHPRRAGGCFSAEPQNCAVGLLNRERRHGVCTREGRWVSQADTAGHHQTKLRICTSEASRMGLPRSVCIGTSFYDNLQSLLRAEEDTEVLQFWKWNPPPLTFSAPSRMSIPLRKSSIKCFLRPVIFSRPRKAALLLCSRWTFPAQFRAALMSHVGGLTDVFLFFCPCR